MMRWIVGSSLKFRFLVVAAGAAMVFVGVGQLRDSPVDVFPEFAQPRVEIQTISLGLNATEVESLVTVPLEQSLQGLPDVEIVRSKSVAGLSSIQLLFKRGTDILFSRQLVAERIGTVTPTLPTWAAPPTLVPPLSSTSRVMKIGLTSKNLSLMEMSVITYWKIRTRLLQVPGVANVPIWGERLRQMQVQVDPQKLREYGISLDQVMDATADSLDSGLLQFSEGSVIGTGGFVETPNQRLTVQHVMPVVNPTDLATIPIEKQNGKQIVVSDVAELVWGHQPLVGDAVINDGEGLMLIVEKLPWANTLDVTRGVEAALADLQPGLPGIEVDTTIFRPATFIEVSLDNLTKALLIGILLVILVLIAFLFEWRAALISVLTIPLSLVAAGLVLHARGETINVMVLAGLVIALGVIVDDAIIDVQNITRRLRLHRQEGGTQSTASIVLQASLEVRGPIVYATLIILAAVVPIFFLGGLTGAFFGPLALSYVLAVAASLVIALTVVPALSLILLSNSAALERRSSLLERWLEGGYERILAPIVTKPRWAYLVSGLTLAVGVAVTPMLGQSLLPSFKERDFLMHWLTAPDTSVGEETRISVRACQELRKIPGVRNCGAHIGQAFVMDEVVGPYFGENWISIDPKADYDKTLASVQELVNGYPGLYRDVQTYLKERVREVLTGSSEAVVVRIFGDDLSILRTEAEKVLAVMKGIDGLIEEQIDLQGNIPQLEVKVDLAAAQRFGVKPGDVRRASATLIAGEEAGDVFRDGRAYDVMVWSAPETRANVDSIKGLPIDTPAGDQVRMDALADVRIAPTPNVVTRENSSRQLTVSANFEGRDLGAVSRDLEDALEDVHFALGYHAEMLGEYKERQDAQRTMLIVGLGAALAIFLLLQAAFRSFRLATLSFLTLPMALVGGVLAAYLGDGVLSLGSLVGFFTVFGIAARNGILMINHFQHLEREEGVPFGLPLVLRGARERLSPILMTTLATGLAIVPLVVAGNAPGHEIEHPLAVVVVGGLVTSTLLNLFVVPSLYLRFARPAKLPAVGAPVAR